MQIKMNKLAEHCLGNLALLLGRREAVAQGSKTIHVSWQRQCMCQPRSSPGLAFGVGERLRHSEDNPSLLPCFLPSYLRLFFPSPPDVQRPDSSSSSSASSQSSCGFPSIKSRSTFCLMFSGGSVRGRSKCHKVRCDDSGSPRGDSPLPAQGEVCTSPVWEGSAAFIDDVHKPRLYLQPDCPCHPL